MTKASTKGTPAPKAAAGGAATTAKPLSAKAGASGVAAKSATTAKLPAKTKAPARPAPPPVKAKPSAKPVANSPAKPLAKGAAKPAAKPAPAPLSAVPAAPVTQPAPAPSAKSDPKSTAVKPASSSASKQPSVKSSAKSGSSKHATVQVPPGANRFSERFSPPKPPMRGLPEPMEIVRSAHKADPKLVNAWKAKAGRDLTEPELLAMPEAEYMNEKQIEFFRVRLQALKDDLLSNAGETTEHLREDTTIVPDPADRATIEEEHALELRTRDRERKLLKKISQSLTRLESGEYGFCDETGEPIGLGRLLARPTANLSLEAQQRRELKQKMFGD